MVYIYENETEKADCIFGKKSSAKNKKSYCRHFCRYGSDAICCRSFHYLPGFKCGYIRIVIDFINKCYAILNIVYKSVYLFIEIIFFHHLCFFRLLLWSLFFRLFFFCRRLLSSFLSGIYHISLHYRFPFLQYNHRRCTNNVP